MKHYSQFGRLNELAKVWSEKNLGEERKSDLEFAKKMNVEGAGWWMDYQKSLVDREAMGLLFAMAREAGMENWREKMFAGEKINFTENRAVLHTALRHQGEGQELLVDGENVRPLVANELAKMANFTTKVRDGEWRGYTGREITDVVNIGIGGSDLGSKMVVNGLSPYQHGRMNFHFLSNVDGEHSAKITAKLDPETTMFIVVSKSFTTPETMMNAYSARDWFMAKTNNQGDVRAHFVAVSTNLEAVREFGIDEGNVFGFWDWVGGRYSIWSAAGLVVMMAIGADNFREFLAGGYAMDEHFRQTPLENNLPVVLGMLGVWYRNFMNFPTYGVMPYAQNLEYLSAHLQQLEMESNGKFVNWEGSRVDYDTVGIIWGQPGTNAQHAFYQALHQGTSVVPLDMILAANPNHNVQDHHKSLMANCLAQMDALAYGRSYEDVLSQLVESGMEQSEAKKLAMHKTFEGNRPSILMLCEKLTPRALGSLLALYEHKVFVQGIIWQINTFDQMGVELGKVLAKKYEQSLDTSEVSENLAVEKIREWSR